MPLHDVGYRAWKGTRRPPGSAAFVIATTGIALSWKSRWLRRAVLFAWSPALAFAMSFFAFEQAVEEGRLSMLEVTAQSGRNLDGVGVLGGLLVNALGRPTDGEPAYLPGSVEEIEQTRRTVWSRLLLLTAPEQLPAAGRRFAGPDRPHHAPDKSIVLMEGPQCRRCLVLNLRVFFQHPVPSSRT